MSNNVYSLTINARDLFAGTYYGLYRRPLSEVTGIAEGNILSAPHFALHQNYPNPFNPTTTIKFQIPNTNHVTLKVFDLLGREVTTLVNEEMQPGSYERLFHAEGLASGIYLYQLKVGSPMETKKLLLLR